jgi:uncharacterized membrane protein (DUF4010 family)
MVEPFSSTVSNLAFQLAIAGGLGALIGLERERSLSEGNVAGSRTFPLFAVTGGLMQAMFPELLGILFAGTFLLLAAAYAGKVWVADDIGLTTVMAALLTVILGAMTTLSAQGLTLAIIVGGVTTVLLSARQEIHAFANNIEERERKATLKLIVIAFIVLPVLPNTSMDALWGLNPRFIWLMVVFVTGLSFIAYVLSEAYEAEHGIALTGILGGFISSTATTVSMSERTSETEDLYPITAFAILVASAMMFPRALIEVSVVNASLVPLVAVPLIGMTVVGLIVAGLLYWRIDLDEDLEADIRNPIRVKPALIFAAVFAVVLLVSETAHATAGASGVYGTAFISGLADVDAMAITLSKLAAEGAIPSGVAAAGIVIAAVANTIVKAGIALFIGTKKLGAAVISGLALTSVTGLVLVFLL